MFSVKRLGKPRWLLPFTQLRVSNKGVNIQKENENFHGNQYTEHNLTVETQSPIILIP